MYGFCDPITCKKKCPPFNMILKNDYFSIVCLLKRSRIRLPALKRRIIPRCVRTITLLYSLKGLEILHQERRGKVKTIVMEDFYGILFHKSRPANKQNTN